MKKQFFSKMLEIISKLLSVKSLITLPLVYTICRLAITSNLVISEEVFVGIVMTVVTYYFTRSENSKKGK